MARRPIILLDSSVIVSALFSPTGASALIISLAEQKKLKAIITDYVIEEVESVLIRKAPENMVSFLTLVTKGLFSVVRKPTGKEVDKAEALISDPEDAPILAVAAREGVDYLVTLDRRDFLKDKLVVEKSGVKIVLPGTFVRIFRGRGC